MSGSDSISSEEDFGVVLPGLTTRVTDYEPLFKQHRRDEGIGAVDENNPSLHPTHASVKVTTPFTNSTMNKMSDDGEAEKTSGGTEIDVEALLWNCYCLHDLPNSELYERGFLHDNDEPGTPITNTGHETAGLAIGAGPVAIKDIAAITDALGELIFSIDAQGTIRVWRKLPRGMLFIGSLTNLFSCGTSERACGAPGVCHSSDEYGRVRDLQRYFIRTDSAMQWLFFIQVVEHYDSLSSPPGDENTVAAMEIEVILLSMNPTSLRVEYQNQARFEVPAVSMCLRDLELHHRSSGMAIPQYTRQPFLLQHQHEPYLAFFTKRMPQATHRLTGRDEVGVVLIPCAPWRVRKASGENHCQVYRPARISAANLISCCVQQRHPPVSGRSGCPGASGIYPIILIDDHGIIDYAMFCELSHTSDETLGGYEGSSQTKLTLRIIGGLSMACAAGPNSPDARLVKQWITFDRRQRTDFFALLRDAQEHGKKTWTECTTESRIEIDEKLNSGQKVKSNAVKVGIMPLKVELVANGTYFVILSVRWTAVPVDTFTADEFQTTEGSPKLHRINFEHCLHIFHFSSGICAGKHSEWICAARLELSSDSQSELVPYMEALTHQSTVGLSVVDSPNAFLVPEGWTAGENRLKNTSMEPNTTPKSAPCVYIYVPEFLLPNLIGLFDVIQPKQNVEIRQWADIMESRIYGRRVKIFQASFYRIQSTFSQQSAVMARVIRIPRCIGELEYAMRDVESGTSYPVEAASRLVDCKLSEKLLIAGSGGFHAPCVLLRRAVTPSQDLKNLLMQTHVGSMLSPEEIKRLLRAPGLPTQYHRDGGQIQGISKEDTSPATSVYPLLITTSLPPSAVPGSSGASDLPDKVWGSALLTYAAMVDPVILHEVKRGIADLAQALCAGAAEATPSGVDSNGVSVGLQSTIQETLVSVQTSAQEISDRWQAILLKLHQQRDFSCAELLGRQGDFNHPCSNRVKIPKHLTGSSDNLPPESTEREEAGTVKDLVKEKRVSEEPLACDEEKEVEKLQTLLRAEGSNLLLATKRSDHAPASSISLLKHALVHVCGYGTIYVHLFPQVAPLAVERLYRLALRGDYNRTLFHRIIPTAIIQGGISSEGDDTIKENALEGVSLSPDQEAIDFPFFSNTHNFSWLCMPNKGENTNASRFFFTVPDAPQMQFLNGCHTVLGLVVGGKDLITQISRTPLNEATGKPLTDIVISRVDVF